MTNDEKLRDYLKRVTVDLHETRRRLREVERQGSEPLAIIGMSCRYPGGMNSPDELWEAVSTGRDAISGFPTDRGWDLRKLNESDPDHPGANYAREGGFLHDAAEFDADFFSISPREALATDPTQRLLLEASWEAMEDAGIEASSLKGSQTGVFVGGSSSGYGAAALYSVSEDIEGYCSTGIPSSVMSGRISYTFGFEGPAMTVDTACSSSLVALHLACGSLRARECSLALVGGVCIMPSPFVFVEFARLGGLASDGRCKSFADAADGTNWSEGVGSLMVERLSDALRLDHRVLAVVRGSAVNQDGTSNGLTAPNGPSQQRVIRSALANAELSAHEVDAVEGHGTGTTLGDPIEVQALLATYGQNRLEENPLSLGSIKSNMGHSQAAAGIAGLVKIVKALQHESLPKTLHVDRPTEKVDWSAGALSLLTDNRPWPRSDRPRRAGVSSFGVSGTNAHVILEEAPVPTRRPVAGEGDAASPPPAVLEPGAWPLLLSARSEQALREQAVRLSELVGGKRDTDIDDVGISLLQRSSFACRGVVIGEDRQELLHGLGALAGEASAAGVIRGTVRSSGPGGVVFVFPGQGAQWTGMALELLERSPLFAARLRECGEALAPHTDWLLEDVLSGSRGAPGLERVDVVQPCLFAIMVALAQLWRACGVHPDVVLGHSQGEIAAACVAGALSLEDAARLVALRSRALVALAGLGGMVSIAGALEDVEARLRRFEGRVSVAAVNGPGSLVVSGESGCLEQLLESCEADGVKARRIPVDYAAHSPGVEQIRTELLEGCAGIVPRSGGVPFCSSVTGGLLDGGELDADYWYRNLRDTVRFQEASRTLMDAGHRTFLELSPHPVLTVALHETADGLPANAEPRGDGAVTPGAGELTLADRIPASGSATIAALGSLRREEGGPRRFLTSLGEAWAHGVSVDWETVFRGSGARAIQLPTYPFERKRYWLQDGGGAADAMSLGLREAEHPLLGAAVALADGEGMLFTGRLSLATHQWLSDHAVMGTVVVPGTAFLELALHAGARMDCEALSELTLVAPMVLNEQDAMQIQVVVGEAEELGVRSVSIHSRLESEALEDSSGLQAWTTNASGTLAPRDALGPEQAGELAGGTWPPEGAQRIEIEGAYDRLAEFGFDYGPAFQGMRAVWRRGEQIFVEVALPDDQQSQASLFGVHPALLDAALHSLAVSLIEPDANQEQTAVRMPFSLNDVSLHATGASSLRVCLSPVGSDGVSVVAADESGAAVLAIGSLVLRPVSEEQLAGAHRVAHDSLFRLDWIAIPTVSEVALGSWAALGSSAAEIAAAFEAGAVPGDGVSAYADLAGLGDAIDEGMRAPETVFVGCPLRSENTGTSVSGEVLAATHAAVHETLELVQAWLADERFSTSRLVLITRGAVAARGGEEVSLSVAPIWGLVRSAQAEDPSRFVLTDLDSEQVSFSVLLSALASDEPQLAIREGVVFVPRLARVGSGPVLAPPPDVSAWRLEAGDGGTFEGLRLVPATDDVTPLEPGEVRIAMRAAGLNFRDVVVALGLIPLGEGEEGLGGEGAGVVVEVGSAVDGIEPGDRVMGLLRGAFGTTVIVDRRLIVPIPDGWSFTKAASLSGVFLTAYYGLVDLAGLKRGERLLVHAATGGVGMAAVQIAKHLGAEVWSTASPAKWGVLREMGVDDAHIASSRDLSFREQYLDATDGEGVDVVLNSLAREYVDASLELLPRGGRFIEMGKTDIRDPQHVADSHPGVVYRALHLPEAGPQRIQEMLTEILGLFQHRALEPPPVRTWDVRRAPEAFRFMSQARHVGKIVLTLPVDSFESRGTALVTGGLGGLGALVAKHLVVEHGMRSVVVTGRRGREVEGADELEAELTALGARVEIVACDVSNREQVAALIESIPADRPLSVVVHCAGVLDDGVIGSLTPERIDGVFAPKVDAAFHLHELTKDLDLQAFILFSAAAGIIGSPGQGNYAAANVFMDALATYRQGQGLPAISMVWGRWQQRSEMMGRLSEADLTRLEQTGIGAFSSQEGLELFDAALGAGEAMVVPLRLDPGTLRVWARQGVLPTLLHRLVRVPVRQAGRGSLRARLAGVPSEERRQVALAFVCSEVAAVLGHSSPDAIQVNRAFKDLGFDSLLAVEIRNRVNAASGLRLPTTLVFDYPNPAALADHLLSELGGIKFEAAAPTVALRVEEPIAIVGMSCRYPGGARSPQELWELVDSATDAMGAFPTDRGWELGELDDGKRELLDANHVCEGGFIYEVAEFDADFFGISPREALAMDPQQRLLLEATWEAFENAGLDPYAMHGSQTGVFAGVSAIAYGSRVAAESEGLESLRVTGALSSIASGRIAYTFGLEGPAMSIDTACSSSLVAMHLASGALRSGECSLALAGGVTVMPTPDSFVEFTRQGALAGDGRCKSFSASADGTGWGEGVGMVLLERLSDAERNGHEVLALVRGSAVNQDGASNGLTAPSGLAQQRVIRQALVSASLSGADVDAVEAHGTGTVLGDPIEAHSLLATYGQRRERPLWLGSIKSNIGHTQLAAGIAGVIKMVMALRHERLPKTLHIDAPTDKVDWTQGMVSLLTDSVAWPRGDEPRRAGVSSFGMSGTNAHLIVEEAPARQGAQVGEDAAAGGFGGALGGVVPWVLSGRERGALRSYARRLRGFVLDGDRVSVDDVGLSLARRSVFEHRAVVLGSSLEQLSTGLEALYAGSVAPGVFEGVAGGGGKVAFLFTGQGAQRAGMSRELYRAVPPFKSALDGVCVKLDVHLGCSLLEVLFAEEQSSAASLLDDTMFAQAGLFALEVALSQLVEAWGVRPAYLIGHSIGELSAAFVAGVLSLDDACTLVAARGRLMSELPSGGAMMAVQACEQEALESLAGCDDRVALAAVNGPQAVVLSGDEDAVLELAENWRARGRLVKRLKVSHAFHSPRMEGMLEDFAEVAHSVSFNTPRIPIVSNLTGGPVSEELCSPDYWVRQVRETVRFAEGVSWLGAQGVRGFLELGPDGVLSAMTTECLEGDVALAGEREARAVAPLLRAELPETASLVGALAQLWTQGASVDWAGMSGEPDAKRVGLPTYPFQRRRYWLGDSSSAQQHAESSASADGLTPAGAEHGFWGAVERGDLDGLLGVLGVGEEGQRDSWHALLPDLTAWRRRSRERSTVNGWCYRVQWQPLAAASAPVLSGAWLVVVPSALADDRWVATLRDALQRRGAHVVAVHPEDAVAHPREELARRLRAAEDGVSEELGVEGVISLLALAEHPHRDCASVPQGLAGTVALVQALGDIDLHAPLWLVTRGAVSVAPSDRVCSPLQAQVWGLGVVAGLEHPQRWGGLVDLPEELEERAGYLLAGVLAEAGPEDQLAIRGTGVLARRVVRSHVREDDSAQVWTPPAGTVLITGGTGGLGAHVARWLARGGAEHLLLLSRRGVDAPGATELQAELIGMGTQVTIAACDVARREQVAELIASLPEHRPLSAVVHAAGASALTPLDSLTASDLEQALSAKAQGALNLDVLTESLDLAAFVLFSSISGTLGSGLQASYAAANACLDALAAQRRARGLSATSVAWGPWAGEGMVRAGQDAGKALRQRGLDLMAPSIAIQALQTALLDGDAFVMVADVRWDTYAPLFTLARSRPLIEDLPEVRAALLAAGPGEQQAALELRERLQATPAEDRKQMLLELVCTEAARILGHASPEVIDPNRPFMELGFNSLMAVELRGRVNGMTNLQIPTSVMLDRPTPDALATHIDLLLSDLSPNGSASSDATELQSQPNSSAQNGSPGTLTSMFREALRDGVVDQFIGMLGTASKFRPTFRAAAASDIALDWATLAEGGAPGNLICLPTTLAISSLHQYVRLAHAFRGSRTVSALALPGFSSGEPLPESLEAAIRALAVAVERRSGDAPFSLVGHSSGGWLAHATASYLERAGAATPTAVILLDSPRPGRELSDGALGVALGDLLTGDVLGFVNDDRLMAMGAYMRLLADWLPLEIAAPTLLVRAGEPLPVAAGKLEDYERWELAGGEVEVPGHHFTMMEEHVDSTAQAIQAWLSTTLGQ